MSSPTLRKDTISTVKFSFLYGRNCAENWNIIWNWNSLGKISKPVEVLSQAQMIPLRRRKTSVPWNTCHRGTVYLRVWNTGDVYPRRHTATCRPELRTTNNEGATLVGPLQKGGRGSALSPFSVSLSPSPIFLFRSPTIYPPLSSSLYHFSSFSSFSLSLALSLISPYRLMPSG
jgi:hypothetical protein